MAVVIRLQGLTNYAGSSDIRRFFTGLTIPDGGVHIIGGELGEAFIIFATDEDARRAMTRSDGFIEGSRVKLLLSSKTEMQNTIELSRKRFERGKREAAPVSRRSGSSSFGAGGIGKMHNPLPNDLVVAVKQEMNKNYVPSNRSGTRSGGLHANSSRESDSASAKSSYGQKRKDGASFNYDDLFLFLCGMPYSVTESDVRTFFQGLSVDGVILLKDLQGRNNGYGLVKFATYEDAMEGIKRDKQYIGSRYVKVNRANEKRWISAGGSPVSGREVMHVKSKERSPSHNPNYPPFSKRSRSPRRERTRSRSPHSEDLCVQLRNISFNLENSDIQNFFQDLYIQDDQIKFLYDERGKRTREAFVVFKKESDYYTALSYHKKCFASRTVYIFPISKKAMLEMIETTEGRFQVPRERAEQITEEQTYSNERVPSSPRACMYVRNLPFDVTVAEVQNFFEGFFLADEDIHLLYDDRGIGLGEALVRFNSEEEAIKAERLNRQRFLGTEVLLRLISEEQMQGFGINISPKISQSNKEDFSQGYDGGDSHSFDFQGSAMKPVSAPGDFQSAPPPMQRFEYNTEVGSYGRFDAGNNGMGGYPEGGYGPEPGFHGSTGNPRGAVAVKLQNLPFKATVNEILDFFYGYRVVPDSVKLQYNERGLSTGDAIIALETYEEAVAAVQELNDRPVGPRKVRLSLL
ncbi:RNA binding motif protein 12Bb [Latimeria chalumnae]|uniref:RNA binding motif protein 12B n=1 Tax=Latimeria chalumnae TaxID=7897 RepID=H3AEN6_LATCH|nr:PREDICTED: RNA-binding protein 12B [Latimeria chalumnae]XP_006008448.1 PREDICTED: RNA-binding protein 12B [Latimeria chalumnae]XP_006008449.1 PREDICTED: RNA-binding protein 12B [Latimeria chalumnae]XP_006008450.1 PREDICTED: RNA-binding protein 12B [Latimeria chalumnae]XP_014351523.1 PREDICTED: RNA-binding protein 12B [Latimeria chalumnae]XP_014351524.1 PREDICTED: RNA-binding protein 12B [Latimeria chalumnae]XP_014351525.1 PREDICTED: RNA-binding protein 12B [Latimeria chalumnae]|eukprot:XP_006008447.1 PREDICTED: RNA-binding protein 12B [Latimeria chalumnae]